MSFTHTIETNGAFTLDNNDADASYDSIVVFTPDSSGQYDVIAPTLPVSYGLDAIQYNSDDVTVQLDQRRVSIDIDEEDIFCTFIFVGKTHELN